MAKSRKKSESLKLTELEKKQILEKRQKNMKVLLERQPGVLCAMGFPAVQFADGDSEGAYRIESGETPRNFIVCSERYYRRLLELADLKKFIAFHLNQLKPNQKRLKDLDIVPVSQIAKVDWQRDSKSFREEIEIQERIEKILQMNGKDFEKEIAKIDNLRFLVMLAEKLPLSPDFESQFKANLVVQKYLELNPSARETQTEIYSFTASERVREMVRRGTFDLRV